MSDNLKKGDEVEWKSHGSTAEGEVDKSGGEAVHTPDALKKQ